MNKSILIIDGNSIINRAYFGLAGRTHMRAPDGTPTGALYAFMNIYYKFLEEVHPDYMCVCFDLKAPTFRHKMYNEYKATRKPMPDDLALQIPLLKKILDALGIARIELEGFEADDLIGSISKSSSVNNMKAFILTGDKDDLQLVDENISVLMPITSKGQTTTKYFDIKSVKDNYGILPTQFIDLKAIMGDPSDNIPGVKGIGEKGAVKLLEKYETLENIYSNLEEIPEVVSKKLNESKEIAFLSRELATIKCDIPVDEYFERIKTVNPDNDSIYNLFNQFGFKSLIKKLELEVPRLVASNKENHSEYITNKEILEIDTEEFYKIINLNNLYKFDFSYIYKDNSKPSEITRAIIESSGIDDGIFTELFKTIINYNDIGFICMVESGDNSFLLDINDNLFYKFSFDVFDDIILFLKNKKIRIICNEIKEIIKIMKTDTRDLLVFDVSVAAYLLNQFEGKPSLERIAHSCGVGDLFIDKEISPDNRQQSLFDNDIEDKNTDNAKADENAKMSINLLYKIAPVQFKMLSDRKLILLALNIEMPLVGILGEMEYTGFKVDEYVLNNFRLDFNERIKNLENSIYDLTGEKFNINSTKQLAEILFGKLKLPTGKKGKNGYSTNLEVLEMLIDKHPVIKEIISYRQLSKLNSTFVEGLSNAINKLDGRVHTTFQQILTTTGRLSSSNPNLQNIPIKLDEGREIRKAFVAEKDYVLVDADYSQIELRLLASFSGDKNMIEAFINNDDIHRNTAQEIFDLPKELITPAMRSIAKTINFSIVYGIGEYSLSADLGISMKEAGRYISEYHRKYPGVKPYFEKLISSAKETGYVETLFKRRRYINELKSANRNISSFGERAAMNTPVQGTAADIIKIAMVIVHNRLKKEKLRARLILQVHDELIIESHIDDSGKVANILSETMENAVKIAVPLVSQAQIKENWFEKD